MSREGRGGAAMAVFAICAVMGLALVCVLGVAGFVGYKFVSNGKKIARDMAVMNMEMVKEQAIAQQEMLTLNSEQGYLVSGIATIVIGNDSTIRIDGKELQLHGIGEAVSQHLANIGRNVITAKKIRVVVSPVSSANSVGQVIQSCLRAGITIEQITDSGIVIPTVDTHDAHDDSVHSHADSDAHEDAHAHSGSDHGASVAHPHDAHDHDEANAHNDDGHDDAQDDAHTHDAHDDAHAHDAHDHDEAHSHDDAHAHGESDHTDAPATEPAAESEPPSDGAEATAEAAVETVEH